MDNQLLKEAINQLSQTDKYPTSTFERIVLTLLEKYLIEDGKQIIAHAKIPNSKGGILAEVDALLPNGFGINNDPTLVEIKFFDKEKINEIKNILLNNLIKIEESIGNFNVLIILSCEINTSDKNEIVKYLTIRIPSVKIFLWDINNLIPLFNRNVEFISSFLPNLEGKAFKNIVHKSLELKDWKKDREFLLKKLNEAYSNDQLTLMLGAGISATTGLPSWNSLLSRLLLSLISKNLPDNIEISEEDKLTFAQSLQELNGLSPLLGARYINAGLESFENEISDVLYNNSNKIIESELINSIGNLCFSRRGISFGIKAIITYNFDDLVEKKLDELKIIYKPIFRDMDVPSKDELGIYHVHGFLPENKSIYEGLSESLLVFSEKNYHVLMEEPYFWSNLIQLNFFRESNCLLIGLSGTDPNLRRLLEIAKRKNKTTKHFIFLKRLPNSHFEKNFEERETQINTSLIESVNSIHHHLQERSFDELGVNIIWIEEFDELPILIANIASKKNQ